MIIRGHAIHRKKVRMILILITIILLATLLIIL
jgi:hypothetical protein